MVDRPRLGLQYKVAELQYENWSLRYFLSCLQQSTEQENHQLLVRLRSLSPEYLRLNVDVLYNLIHQVSSTQNQSHLGSSCIGIVQPGQDSKLKVHPDSKQGARPVIEPRSTTVLHDNRESKRLAWVDTDLLLRVLHLLRKLPVSERNSVLQSWFHTSSPEVPNEHIPRLKEESGSADLPPIRQQHPPVSPSLQDQLTPSTVVANCHAPEIQARRHLNSTSPKDSSFFPMLPASATSKASLGSFLISFLDAVSTAVSHGTPVEQIIGPQFVDAEYLLRDRKTHENGLTVAVWAGSVARSMLPDDLATTLAKLICVTRLVRWMISPTLKHYAEIPEIARPLPVQRSQVVLQDKGSDLRPHAASRCTLARQYRDWFTTWNADDLRFRWHGSPDQMLMVDSATGHRRPTELFENYVTTSDNWGSIDSKTST